MADFFIHFSCLLDGGTPPVVLALPLTSLSNPRRLSCLGAAQRRSTDKPLPHRPSGLA